MESFKPLIAKVAAGSHLTRAEAVDAFEAMLSGEVTPSQMGGFLMALRVRGESVEEITGAVTAMRAKMLRVIAPDDAIDIVGTGGDGSGSYNVSTLAALIVAACGVPVAKHGNRAASSKSGTADTLERARRQDRHRAGGGRALHPRGGNRLHDGARPSRRDAPCRPDARRTRHAHRVQSARAPVQSGGRQAAIDRRLLRRMARADGGGAAQSRLGAGVDHPRRRRARRNDDDRRHQDRRIEGRRHSRLRGHAGKRRPRARRSRGAEGRRRRA